MHITLKDEVKKVKFNARSGVILFNEREDKVLLENQKRFYVFPGGRIDILEDSLSAVKREMMEELGISLSNPKLKYIIELNDQNKYHEIGFYYIDHISDMCVFDNTKNKDGDGVFEWASIDNLEEYDIATYPLVFEIKNRTYKDNGIKYVKGTKVKSIAKKH